MRKFREDCVIHAKISETSQRYYEMVEDVRAFCSMNQELDVEEQNLLASSYKHVVNQRRRSWVDLIDFQHKNPNLDENKLEILDEYRKKIQKELEIYSEEAIHIASGYIKMNSNMNRESLCFYHLMQADHYRYLCEVALNPEQRRKFFNSAKELYLKAQEISEKLLPVNPLRLSIALNYSIFLSDIVRDEKRAVKVAAEAFEEAKKNAQSLSERSYQDSTLLMEMLKQNIFEWKIKTAESFMNKTSFDERDKKNP